MSRLIRHPYRKIKFVLSYRTKKPILKVLLLGSAEGHEYSDLQVGDEVNPRWLFFMLLKNR